jgi:hypothetical protein
MRRAMSTMVPASLASLLLCALFASQGAAQTSSNAPSDSSAQNTASSSQAADAPAQPAAKKVWTNDDMGELRRDSAISTVGAKTKPQKNAVRPANSKGRNAQWYQGQITRLQAQLPPIEDKIGQLQAALRGQTVNTVRTWGGVKPDDWRVELANLQQKHDDIEANIATLRDQARHDGVPPNQIP